MSVYIIRVCVIVVGIDMPLLPKARVFCSYWPMFPSRIIEQYTLARTSRDFHLEKQQPRGGKNSREIFEWHVKVAYGDSIQTCRLRFGGREKWQYSQGRMFQNLFLFTHSQT